MSLHNGLNNTEEFEVPEQPQQPVYGYPEQPEYGSTEPPPAASGISETQEIEPVLPPPAYAQERPAVSSPAAPRPSRPRQPGANPGYPPRQPIHRATFTPAESEPGKKMPRRRPPRETEEAESKPAAAKPKKKKRKKRRRSCIGRLIASILTFALVIFVIYSCIAIFAVKKLQYNETGNRRLEENSIAIQDDQVRNILLIFTNGRATEKGRADAIIVMSLSKHNKSITFTTIQEDSYVNIPTYEPDLLKNAYAYGGPTLLMDTVTNNYGIPVDEYLCCGFSAFINLADAFGGIQMKVSEAEKTAINKLLTEEINMKMREADNTDLLQSAGDIVLNGRQLLAYFRLKVDEASKQSPEEYRNRVINGLLEKAKSMDLSELKNIVKKSFPVISTNMDTLTLYLLSLTLPIDAFRYDTQTMNLPIEGSYSYQVVDGKEEKVMVVDCDKNLQYFRTKITEPLPAK